MYIFPRRKYSIDYGAWSADGNIEEFYDKDKYIKWREIIVTRFVFTDCCITSKENINCHTTVAPDQSEGTGEDSWKRLWRHVTCSTPVDGHPRWHRGSCYWRLRNEDIHAASTVSAFSTHCLQWSLSEFDSAVFDSFTNQTKILDSYHILKYACFIM